MRVRWGRQVPCVTFSSKHSLFSPVRYLGPARSLSFPIIWGTGPPSVVLSAEDLGLGAAGAGPASQAWM